MEFGLNASSVRVKSPGPVARAWESAGSLTLMFLLQVFLWRPRQRQIKTVHYAVISQPTTPESTAADTEMICV